MIDLDRLAKLRLHRTPPGQLLVAELLRLDYALPRKTEIVVEHLERLPRDRQVFLAMNHTDKFNYWPLQYTLHRQRLPYTATWVKGKYYHNRLIAGFLDATNNIPMPSRGYVLVADFTAALRRKPHDTEYRFLRDLVDGKVAPQNADLSGQSDGVRRFVGEHGGDLTGFVRHFEARFEPLIDHVIRLNRQAICELGLNVLVFPQGTRSVRLSRGHAGLVQLAMHLGAAIVPIGCNGSDVVYPSDVPSARGGRIVYRIGEPLELSGPDLGPWTVREAFKPLSLAAAARHGEQFAGATAVVMDRINDLLDPKYQFSDDGRSGGVQGMARFL